MSDLLFTDPEKLDRYKDELAAIECDNTLVAQGFIGRLTGSWRHFAEVVEYGYPFGLDDYTEMLYRRSVIEELLPLCSPKVKAVLLDAVKPSDEIFLEATHPFKRALSSYPIPVEHIWWRRMPKKKIEYFEEMEANLDMDRLVE